MTYSAFYVCMCLKQHKRAITSSFEEWIKQVSAVTELGAILVDKQVIPLKTYEGICKHRMLVACMFTLWFRNLEYVLQVNGSIAKWQ